MKIEMVHTIWFNAPNSRVLLSQWIQCVGRLCLVFIYFDGRSLSADKLCIYISTHVRTHTNTCSTAQLQTRQTLIKYNDNSPSTNTQLCCSHLLSCYRSFDARQHCGAFFISFHFNGLIRVNEKLNMNWQAPNNWRSTCDRAS